MISQALADSLLKKWNPVLESAGGIADDEIRLNTAMVMENTERFQHGLRPVCEAADVKLGVGPVGIPGVNTKGDTTSGVLGKNSGYTTADDGTSNNVLPSLVIPMIRRIFPELMAHTTMSVQPMTGPVGYAFAFRSLYNAKGGLGSPSGSVEVPSGEYNGTTQREIGYNNIQTAYTGKKGTAPTAAAAASAWNSFTGASEAGSGVPYKDNNFLGTGASTEDGEWASIADGTYPTIGFDFKKVMVEAKSRKLAAHWSLELQEDAKAMQGVDVSEEMVGSIGYELQSEIDRQLLVSQVLAGINAGNVSHWTPVSADALDQHGRISTLLVEINYAANLVAEQTRRGSANFAIAPTRVTSLLQSTVAQSFIANEKGNIPGLPNNGVGTLLKVGLINGGSQLLIRDTLSKGTYVLLGYKGSQTGDSGVIFCPYVPVQMMQATDPNTFTPILGARTRYGVLDNAFGSGNYFRYLMVEGINAPISALTAQGRVFLF
jgi:hypothetical protein